MVYLFDVPAYFILLRETLEVTIILAVLLGFIDKLVPEKDVAMRRTLKLVFYTVAKNLWEENGAAWEGSFAFIASVVITFMALSMARVQQWRKKWERKLEEATESYLRKHQTGNRWALILLPFTVICREAVETFVFIGGIGFDRPASDLPIPAILGLLTGFIVGWILYKGSHKLSINIFFSVTSAFLLFIAAGLFSYSIHEFQEATGTEEVQLWFASCCNEKTNEFWGIMKTIFGWRAKATVGTTAGYFSYWAFVLVAISIIYFVGKRNDAKELDEGRDPEIGEKKPDHEVVDKPDNV
ncbi:12625_t:CDS:2 [Entrophospora sp. SA101]|nr:12286_t:CDS:2 [Entrophospora sp. SA101]CAJ0826425.1 12625_t:CDS:2 [Entrophospora sp. SA101]